MNPASPTPDLPFPDARQRLLALAEPLATSETVPLMQALGRVLARDVISPVSVPPHDNSAMDGFAFAGESLRAMTSVTLTCVGTVHAGQAWQTPVLPGQCLKIMTGAVMPQGLDTVVPQELATVDGPQVTIAAGTLQPGDNRRLAGEDLCAGQAALHRGQTVTPAAWGLLASLGLTEVPVQRRLRVAYFSTGNEILSLGEAPREGAVYDSNRFTVLGLLSRLGVDVIDLGRVKDDPAALEHALQQAADAADVVITSGGVSVGEADHTKAVMQALGSVEFWRIAMRPGRPMAAGRIRGRHQTAVLFGLPGNPVAVMVTFLTLVRPALLRMMGSVATEPVLLHAFSETPIRKKAGRTEFQRCTVRPGADGKLWVRSTGNQGSGVLRSMVQANGLLVLNHEQGPVQAGDAVQVLMLDGVT